MTIEPLGPRVLIQPLEQETTTASGIVLPETAKEKPQQGIVKAVGTEDDMTTDLAVGNKVLFPKYTGNEITLNGTKYLIMDEGDILARLKD
ncbi:MAG: 10 kDa chaperonin [Anaerolineae bacterium]|nr:10 kDa chaperonin [Anaerolineae bacterium]